MNRDMAQGDWKQLSGKIKQKWGKLTEDDLTRAEGDRDYLVGRLQEQYGIARDKVEGELDTLGYANAGSSKLNDQGGNLDREGPAGRGSSDHDGNANFSLDGQGAGHTLEAGSAQDKSGQRGQGGSPSRSGQEAQKQRSQGPGNSKL